MTTEEMENKATFGDMRYAIVCRHEDGTAHIDGIFTRESMAREIVRKFYWGQDDVTVEPIPEPLHIFYITETKSELLMFRKNVEYIRLDEMH